MSASFTKDEKHGELSEQHQMLREDRKIWMEWTRDSRSSFPSGCSFKVRGGVPQAWRLNVSGINVQPKRTPNPHIPNTLHLYQLNRKQKVEFPP